MSNVPVVQYIPGVSGCVPLGLKFNDSVVIANPKIHYPEIILSVDGEFTGPIPQVHSMISFGVVAYDQFGVELACFKANLEELDGAIQDPDTMDWWAKYPDAWKAATTDPVPPEKGMVDFDCWLSEMAGYYGPNMKLAGWPLPVDFMFLYWYYWKFLGKKPLFSYDGVDIKTFAMAKLGLNRFLDVSRKEVEKRFGIAKGEFSHDPLDDARRQAELYFSLKFGRRSIHAMTSASMTF